MAIVLALSALAFTSTASAGPPPQTYLGLGDSLAFGYSQQLFNENEPKGEPPNAFNNGYVNYYFKALKLGKHGALTNNGCPGETTNSFIGNGPLEAALGGTKGVYGEEEETSVFSPEETVTLADMGVVTAEEFPFVDTGNPDEANASGRSPCKYHTAHGFRLHHEYGGTKSQLESALEVIKNAASGKDAKPVMTVTLNLGANDELHAVTQCKEEVGGEYAALMDSKYNHFPDRQDGKTGTTEAEAFHWCVIDHVGPLFKHILENIGKITFALREGSKFGGINYTGKIIVLGGYDPYGRVFCPGETFANVGNAPTVCSPGFGTLTPEQELVPESNNLTALLNALEKKLITTEIPPPEGCYGNPQPTFNPQSDEEPGRLQEWTNMDNKKISNGKADGNGTTSDIHPTGPKMSAGARGGNGYQKLASILPLTCP